MRDFDRQFKRTQRTIGAGFIITIVLVIVFFVGSIFLISYVVGAVRERGLKGIVEEIWEGEDKDND